ncbi:hypothetical protein MNBD_GAMMA10-1849 [hydrothermal vent metagenome]|uniref:Uncharacterized protein n=1 Tax=hydrothermal vent metagenome TaxID=652676 RepID=A0A3B0X4S5_9ZZZZ
MLPMIRTPHTPMIIAGKDSGSKVIVMHGLEQAYAFLEIMAKEKQNHWAAVAVKEMKSLTSGHHKSSVYIHAGEILGQSGQQFRMVLPGCEISFIRFSSSEYLINKMDVSQLYDELYDNMQKAGTKPGFYNVEHDKISDSWIPAYQPDGQVKNEMRRTVAITDQYEEVEDAAETAGLQLGNASIGASAHDLKQSGFDMHFTPGKAKIGGLMNVSQARNATTSESLHESALQLARTMTMAKDVEGVSWISAGGGSGVLTQAMAILKTKGVSFEETKHHVFFSHLTTDLVIAQKLATDIGLEFGDRVKSTNFFNLNESVGGLGLIGGYVAAWQRQDQDPNRTRLMLVGDMTRETIGSLDAVKTAGVTGVAVGVALGVATAIPATPLIVFAAAMGGAASLGIKLTKAAFPESYAKFISKFG